ncbi:MAG: response regulator [Oscillospiraceae bacterium]|nr:response regulator [Oscillospiraceae bacterium]
MNTITFDPDAAQTAAVSGILTTIDPDGMHLRAETPVQAERILANTDIDVLYMEIPTAEQGGMESIRRLVREHPQTNLVFLTSHPEFALEAHKLYASAYLQKPATPDEIRESLSHLRFPLNAQKAPEPLLRVQCFGGFAVFCDEVQVTFRRGKTIELMAYLVYKRGAMCSNAELVHAIWGEKTQPAEKYAYLRKLIKDLRDTFHEIGADGIVLKAWNAVGIRPELIECDYYRYLSGSRSAADQFRGTFIGNYPWAKDASRYF